jgi:hypothetical protein
VKPEPAGDATLRRLGLALSAALALVVAEKIRAGEAVSLLWICYPAAALLCAGLVGRRALLAAAGGLFYLVIGLPYWVIGLVVTRSTSVGSVAVHLLAPLAGVIHLRRVGLPVAAKWLAGALYLGLLAISRALTPPALNINLAFGPYAGIGWELPLWAHYGFNMAIGLALLVGGDQALRRLVSRSSGTAAIPS